MACILTRVYMYLDFAINIELRQAQLDYRPGLL